MNVKQYNKKGVLRMLVCYVFICLYISVFLLFLALFFSNTAQEPQILTIRAKHFNETQHGFIYYT